MNADNEKYPPNFISRFIEADLARQPGQQVRTRFPPEPNGYLHIGHAKAICLNFGIARDFGGVTNLRFDDTNPLQEDTEFVAAIQEDIRWLGFEWDQLHFASDYFDQLYEFALQLIRDGKAYVDSLNQSQIREYRGTLTEPGNNSPYRERSVQENLDLFQRMKAGEFADGDHVLRMKLDMAAPNINLRDPTLYRIRHARHHRTGDSWCIYPLYDFTHCLSDALEGITHSLCDLTYEDHRPLYDRIVMEVGIKPVPRQIEFSRLNMNHTVMSKRYLRRLVQDGLVDGWDDPRMPTLSGMRRRGYPPAAIRDFCRRIGVAKADSSVELSMLEAVVREVLEPVAYRVLAVLDPLKLVITNYPSDQETLLEIRNHPKDADLGVRQVSFGREIYIEREDFMETAGRRYKRLVLGGRVRLRGAYVIQADQVIRDAAGGIREVHCSYLPDTLGRNPQAGKPRGVIHWVCAATGVPAEVRLMAPLFTESQPNTDALEYSQLINADSCRTVNAVVEASLSANEADRSFQFERIGYFRIDDRSRPEALVFNRTVSLRDSYQPGERPS